MGKDYLVEGAKLMCINGGEMKLLQVPIGHGYTSDFKKKANCGDCKACENIPYFGSCKKNKETHTCKGYMLLADKWENISPGSNFPEMINGKEAITMDSVLICKKGGLIVPLTSGQGYDKGIDMNAFLKRFEKIFKWVAGKNMLCQIFGKDPINMNTGNYIYEKEDLVIGGVTKLSFKLFYNVMENGKGACLGAGWHHNHEIMLKKEADRTLILCLGDGKQSPFHKLLGDVYGSIYGDRGLIKKVDEGYLYYLNEGEEYLFDEAGRLIQKLHKNGLKDLYYYNREDQLESVAGGNGGHLQFYYNKEKKLIRVNDHAGREVQLWYRYGKLWKYINPLGYAYFYEYNENLKLESITTPRGIKGLLNEYDGADRVLKQTLPDGSVTQFRYDDTNNRTYMREQNGNMIIYESDEHCRNTKTIYANGEEIYEYNDKNQKTLFIDKNGNKTRYKYDDKGKLSGTTNALGEQTALVYDDRDHITMTKFPDGSIMEYKYDSKGNLIEYKDPCGNITRMNYRIYCRPETIKAPDGGVTCLTYDDRGNVTSITDAMENQTIYEYDLLNRVTKVIDGNGNSRQFAYNKNNDVIKEINTFGNEKKYEYSTNGKVTEIKHFDGSTEKMWYNASNRPERYENQDGSTTAYEYDKMGNPVCVVLPSGGKRNLTYDKFNRLVQYEDATGGITKLQYDPCGNVIETVNTRGGSTKYTFDALNRKTEVIDPEGRVTKYEYDVRGNLTGIIYPAGRRTNREYDACGRIIWEKNVEGNVTQFSYNAIGRLAQIKDAAARIVSYTYFPGGLLKGIKYPDGNKITFKYDGNRNVIEKWYNEEYGLFYSYDQENHIKQIRSSDQQEISYDYDLTGNLICSTDVYGNKSKYSYTLSGMLSGVEDAEGNLSRYQYDAMGNLVSIFRTGSEEERQMNLEEAMRLNESQHNLHLTLYERDIAGQIVAITNPLGYQDRYTYNSSGDLIKKINKDGYATSFDYTLSGEINSISYDDGRRAEYSYNELSRLKQVKDWLGTLEIDYDPQGRVQKITDHRGKSVSYEYGSRNEKTAVVYPDNTRTEYIYDDLLRLKEVRGGKQRVQYQYGEHGWLTERVRNNGIKTEYSHDHVGRLLEFTHKENDKIIEDFKFSYDKLDHKIGVRKYRRGLPEESGTYRYFYDKLERLSGVEKDGELIREYSYDPFHNRTGKQEGEEQTEYFYNAADQMIRTQGKTSCIYLYDKRGNIGEIIRDGITEKKYRFDATGKMSEAMADSGISRSYLYNGLGKRVSVLEQAEGTDPRSIDYTLDLTKEYHNLLSVEGEKKSQRFLWGKSLEGMEEDGTAGIALLDEMGSTLRFLWSNGNDLERYSYDEFGGDITGNAGRKQPFGYTGYLPDPVSGTLFAQAREYMPGAGRFSGEDILKGDANRPTTLNQYIYCCNSPIDFLDFLGLDEFWWKLLEDGREADALLKEELLSNPDIAKDLEVNVYIPKGLGLENSYYTTPSGHGFADFTYKKDEIIEVYELKHEGMFGRIMGSLQLAGYIEAIQNNKTDWEDRTPVKGELLNDFMKTKITSKDGKRTYYYYTTPLFPGMIFWTREKRDPQEEVFAKVLEEDKKKVDELLKKLLGSGKAKVLIKDLIAVIVELSIIASVLGNDAILLFYDDILAVAALAALITTFEEMTDIIMGDCDQIS